MANQSNICYARPPSAPRSMIASFLKFTHVIGVYEYKQPWKFHQIWSNRFCVRAIYVLIYAYTFCEISQKPFKRFAYINNQKNRIQIL